MEHDGFEEDQAAVDADHELIRQYRDDWFARQLGEGWVMGEDGIYYPPGAAPPRHAEPTESLEDALRPSVPGEPDGAPGASNGDESSRRGLWRRRRSGSSR